MGLRAKFNLVMLAAFTVGLVLAGFLMNRLLQGNARQAVLQEAAVMMGQATAISHYTDTEIGPLLSDQLKVRFLPQSIPFWPRKRIFARCNSNSPTTASASQRSTQPIRPTVRRIGRPTSSTCFEASRA